MYIEKTFVYETSPRGATHLYKVQTSCLGKRKPKTITTVYETMLEKWNKQPQRGGMYIEKTFVYETSPRGATHLYFAPTRCRTSSA